MTPRQVAESTDPEVLRDLLYRYCTRFPPCNNRKNTIANGSADELVELASGINSRVKPGLRIKHGLLID